MTQLFRDGLAGAKRLVLKGHLNEATALLQRTLRGEPEGFEGDAVESRRPSKPPVIEAEPADAAGTGFFDGMISDLRGVFDGFQTFNPFTAAPQNPTPSIETPPGEAPPRSIFAEARFSNAAGSRPYRLYVPSAYDGVKRLQLVVMLHGCTQSPEDFAAGTRMNAFAERDGFLVCYPGQTSAANGNRCWNWFNDSDQKRDRGEPSIIADITRDVMAKYAVDPARVYVAGLSAGGALAATMGQAYPDLYAAVGVHSGLACGAARDVSSAFAAMRQGGGSRTTEGSTAGAPAIVFHGDRDGTVSPVNGDEVAAQSIHAAAVKSESDEGRVPGGHSYRRIRYLNGQGRALVEQWSIHGAGHAWAGGSTAGSYTDPQGPDASREMLRFFAEHVGPAAKTTR